ncbi:MAG: radical SAM protein [Planctomycetaceae bacterium]|nr:radical SAM protein [Planctomycetaceae bacterium]
MYLRMAKRALLETDKRLVWKFIRNMGIRGTMSVLKFKRRLKRGEYFPPFLYVSVINSCNLRCQGCWVDVAAKQQTIDLQAMSKLITEAKEMGNAFFGIVGGEPFMHPELLEIFETHPDCYFQVFTNGHFITDEVAKRLRKAGNVTPLISVEGTEIVSDERRGREGVLSKTMQGVQNCLNNKLLTGVCTSVCKTNIDELVTEQWADRLIEMGVFYTWFHIYRPMGPDASPELCLTPEQQLRVREFVVEMRAKKPIAIVDAYYDGEGKALCPAATGISHHINPWGDIEPCPIIQFATDSIHDETKSLREKFASKYLSDFRKLASSTTRGCIVLERPDLLEELVVLHDAKDATVRKTAIAELQNMEVRTSQFNPEKEIPEKSWMYRILKRFLFSDFGAYDGHDHSDSAAPFLLQARERGVSPQKDGRPAASGSQHP